MKTTLMILASIALGIAAGVVTATYRVGAPPAPPTQQVDHSRAPTTQPRAELPTTEFDFGSMDANAEREHQFLIRNTGGAPLELSTGETSCRCTISELDRDVLLPGESTAVVVRWHADRSSGPYRQTVTIETNDPQQPRIELSVNGKIIESLWSVPRTLNFGRVLVGQAVSGEMTLLCRLPERLEIVGHDMVNKRLAPFFKLSHQRVPVDRQEYPEAQNAVLLGVLVEPGLPLGTFRQTITLRTNLAEPEEFLFDVEGQVVGDISVVAIGPGWDAERNVLLLGNIPAERGARRTLLLVVRGEHRDQVTFAVDRVTPEWLEVEMGEPRSLSGGTARQSPLVVTIPKHRTPSVHLGSAQGKMAEVHLTTSHPTIPELDIRLSFAIIGGD